MERLTISARPDKASKLESIGLSFHSWDDYWKEDACYRFTSEEVDELEEATQALHGMCLTAVDHVIKRGLLDKLAIPRSAHALIAESWERRDPSLYGRFDLAYDGINPPKMLEYNADTPTSLLESAVAQWYWLEDVFPAKDQFNSLHEKLVDRWKQMGVRGPLYVASLRDNEEDWVCAHYVMETAVQAGLSVEHICVEDIGWSESSRQFIDLQDRPIRDLFKLYPWEWMLREDFGLHVPRSGARFFEPAWKAVLSCKGILPILWELFEGHPNLLPAYFTPAHLKAYAKKPLYSREGANVELHGQTGRVIASQGPYGAEGFIYQQLVELPQFEGKYPIIGSWVVGESSAGMCLREDVGPVTTNMSNFVPHFFE